MLCMFAVMEEEAVEEVVSAASAAVNAIARGREDCQVRCNGSVRSVNARGLRGLAFDGAPR